MDKLNGTLILSRDNLEYLLLRLNQGATLPVIMRRHEDGSELWVMAEDNEAHYKRRTERNQS